MWPAVLYLNVILQRSSLDDADKYKDLYDEFDYVVSLIRFVLVSSDGTQGLILLDRGDLE